MNRSNWGFHYAADKLNEAAKYKMGFHDGRLEWWKAKKEETIASIKSEGIEIDQSLVDDFAKYGHASNSGHRGVNISVKPELMRDLQECERKIVEHRTKSKDYEGWIEVLAAQGSTNYELNHDDWLFFFSRK